MQKSSRPLADFHEFVGKQLTSDETAGLSPDRVLEMWHEKEGTIAAIKAGLEDVKHGRVMSLEEFDRTFRQLHGLQSEK